MIEIRQLREDPEAVRAAISRKGFPCDLDEVLRLDGLRRETVTRAESAKARQKAANDEMARLPKGSDAFKAKIGEMKELAAEAKRLEAEAREVEAQFRVALLAVPNLPDPSVPDGRTEEDNVVIFTHGASDAASFPHAKPHWDVPGFEQGLDFARGVKVTGGGFPFYIGAVGRFVRCLLDYFLERAASAGFVEILAPLLVNEASATATGQLPDKEGQMYADANEGLYLIPTAEVPVTNFYRDEILDASRLPIRHCAYTPCFRREAGSWGKHVRGLNRLHQFDKVEGVIWTRPEESMAELDRLRDYAAGLIGELGLPYRVLLMCAGDIGFPHAKQYDLEVYAAGQQRWLEVSSCSNFTDFQARRANIRYRAAEGGKPAFVHTLNGSILAIPRILAALLENNLREDGTVEVPPIIQQRFGANAFRLGD